MKGGMYMNKEDLGPYNGDVEMYGVPAIEPNIKVLESIKWSVDNGKLIGDTSAEVLIYQSKETREEHMARDGGD